MFTLHPVGSRLRSHLLQAGAAGLRGRGALPQGLCVQHGLCAEWRSLHACLSVQCLSSRHYLEPCSHLPPLHPVTTAAAATILAARWPANPAAQPRPAQASASPHFGRHVASTYWVPAHGTGASGMCGPSRWCWRAGERPTYARILPRAVPLTWPSLLSGLRGLGTRLGELRPVTHLLSAALQWFRRAGSLCMAL